MHWLVTHLLSMQWLAVALISTEEHWRTRREYVGDLAAAAEAHRADRVSVLGFQAIRMALTRTIVRQSWFIVVGTLAAVMGALALTVPGNSTPAAAQIHPAATAALLGWLVLAYLEAVQFILLGLTIHDRVVRRRINALSVEDWFESTDD